MTESLYRTKKSSISTNFSSKKSNFLLLEKRCTPSKIAGDYFAKKLGYTMQKPIYLRAHPSDMHCNESYSFDVNISKFGGMDTVLKPHAEVSLIIPHDGEKYFSWKSIEDLHHQLPQDFQSSSNSDIENIKARLGFLVFENYSQTDLKNHFEVSGSYPIKPIDLNIRNTQLMTDVDLVSDQFESKATFSYTPHELKVAPLKISIMYEDETAPNNSSHENNEEKTSTTGNVLLIQQGFSSEASITIKTEISLPIDISKKLEQEGQHPTLLGFSIDWPLAESQYKCTKDKTFTTTPNILFNPIEKRIELEDFKLEHYIEDNDTGVCRYLIPDIVVSIPNPSELQNLTLLNGDIHITIPTLISQTQIRCFDNTGQQSLVTKAHYQSIVDIHFSHALQEAVLQKPCSPALNIVLDDTTLEQIHVSDIVRILKQLKFNAIQHSHIQEERHATQVKRHCAIEATRSDGPRILSLHLSIDSSSNIPSTISNDGIPKSPTTTIKMHSSVNEDGIKANLILNEVHKLIKERFYRLAKLV